MFRFQTKDFDGVWVAVTKQLDQLSEGINGRIGFYMADLLKISSGQDFAFAVYGTPLMALFVKFKSYSRLDAACRRFRNLPPFGCSMAK